MRPLTRLCFLLRLLGKLFLLALPFLLGICLLLPWSPPFPLHVLALILLSLANVRLSPTLTLSPLMIWYSGLTALFHFLLAEAAPAFCQLLSLWHSFLFGRPSMLKFFPPKPAPFCTLFAGLGSTIKSAISLLYSYYLILVFSSPPCPLLHLSSYLRLCGRSGGNCLLSPSVLSGYNETVFSLLFYQVTMKLSSLSGSIRLQWVPGYSFLPGNDEADELADRERYLRPAQSLVVSLLLSLVFILVLSWNGGVLSHRSSLTHRSPQFPPRNFCSFVMLAVSSLVFAATDTALF